MKNFALCVAIIACIAVGLVEAKFSTAAPSEKPQFPAKHDDYDWYWSIDHGGYYRSDKADLLYDPETRQYYDPKSEKWYVHVRSIPGHEDATDDDPTRVAHKHIGPAAEDDWNLERSSGLYWSQKSKIFYDPVSKHFYDPKTRQWFDTENGKWGPEDKRKKKQPASKK